MSIQTLTYEIDIFVMRKINIIAYLRTTYGFWHPFLLRKCRTDDDLNKYLQGVISNDAASIPWLRLLTLLHFGLLGLT